MMVIYNTAIRTYRNIYACFFKILISCLANFNQSGCLTSTDTLGFTGDTNGTAADTNLNKVCTAVGKETETFSIYYVTCADFNAVAIVLTNPSDGELLPFAETFGGVNAKHICTCL